LKNILALVEKVETKDFDGALDELEVRKNELVETHEYLLDLSATAAPAKAPTQAELDKAVKVA